MKINIYVNSQLKEERIEIHCRKKTNKINRIIALIHATPKGIFGKDKSKIHKILLTDILYFESLDKKTFAYTNGNLYEVDFTLKQLSEQLKT